MNKARKFLEVNTSFYSTKRKSEEILKILQNAANEVDEIADTSTDQDFLKISNEIGKKLRELKLLLDRS